MKCKRELVVGTYNVRTIRRDQSKEELIEVFKGSGLAILAIQEHRICHREEVKVEKGPWGALITSSAWRNGAGAATGGVGFLISREAYRTIKLVRSFSDRILLVSFDGNPALTAISAYSPTECAEQVVAEQFHEVLRGAVHEVPAHNVLVVLGDMNAHLSKESPEDKGWYFHKRTNRNGQHHAEMSP